METIFYYCIVPFMVIDLIGIITMIVCAVKASRDPNKEIYELSDWAQQRTESGSSRREE